MRFNHLTGLLILASLAPLSSSQCPPMWTYYEDVNGTEAHDSCLALFSTQTSSPLPAGALASLCNGFGGHLLTILSSVPGSGIVGAAAGLISGPAIIGCQQTASASQRGAGWRWADDTDGLNINPKDLVSGYDGGNGNGIWSCGEPK